jgi:hypothetical protein
MQTKHMDFFFKWITKKKKTIGNGKRGNWKHTQKKREQKYKKYKNVKKKELIHIKKQKIQYDISSDQTKKGTKRNT